MMMGFALEIKVPGIDKPIRATSISDVPADIEAMIDEMLRAPRRMVTDHTLSTGDYVIARGRPPVNPVRLGSQAFPLGKTELLCRLKPGDILYPGGNDLHLSYGPDNTEPLMARGPVVATVVEEDLEAFFRAGRLIWEAQYRHHKAFTITVSKREAKQ
ncbi:hypothetical protein BUPH_04879 (plasmid) [Paraburkholderia phenoliruptrix BR3459a]|uniref:Uncharacterized protein n=2 Tax=Paraburkholderia phenoliruptrix TaxID=252970 RepID=K0DWB2_9BURK|nr:hypothetical protein BUPH_04879 [Paraburkholderia phenoliruptrix BR3459a]